MGVFLVSVPELDAAVGLPHVRGGVSNIAICEKSSDMSSPRVGVFLTLSIKIIVVTGLPHMRGGVSKNDAFIFIQLQSSDFFLDCHVAIAPRKDGL
ncbi:MAG: hypothetical protein K0Q74_1170 [Gammaproteobacteria bacterium]|nr:hypothetical protein [Gammaproteobacteria bacterium]